MADKRISDLNLHTEFELSDSLPIINNGETKKTTYGSLYYGIRDGVISGSDQISDLGFITGVLDVDNYVTTSSYNTDSSSFDQRIINATNEQSLVGFATTGSNIFNGDETISGSLFISGATELGGNIVPKTARGATLGTSDRPFSEIFVSSGSINIASDIIGDPNTTLTNVGGNILVSAGGMRLVGDASFIAATGSFSFISGSMRQIGDYSQNGNYTMIGNKVVSGSVNISGSLIVNGDFVPKKPKASSLGTSDFPFKEIFVSSGSINIASDTPGDPNTTISNVGGNLLISAGGIRLVGDASFIAATGSFGYISGSMTQVGDYSQTGDYVMVGDKTITGSLNVTNGITGSTDFNTLVNKPPLISGSSQITSFGFVSGSYETTGRGIFSSSLQLPSGLVSGSSQLTGDYDERYALISSVPATQVYYNTAQSVIVNNTTQQSIFGLANGVTVTYATRYKYKIIATVRVTADNVNLYFAMGGTATYFRGNFHAIVGKGTSANSIMPTTKIEIYALNDGGVKTPINISQGGSGGTYFEMMIEGFVDTQYSGYIKPVVLLNPTPGASSFVGANSYMEITPIGPATSGNTDTVIGTWS